LDVVTGKAFVPDSQRWKNIEDITKNINMFAQLHSAVFTAFFTDPLSAGMAGLGPPTLMAPVALLILNSCSTVFVNISVSPKRLL
jgi:hypothetical protein